MAGAEEQHERGVGVEHREEERAVEVDALQHATASCLVLMCVCCREGDRGQRQRHKQNKNKTKKTKSNLHGLQVGGAQAGDGGGEQHDAAELAGDHKAGEEAVVGARDAVADDGAVVVEALLSWCWCFCGCCGWG